MAHTLDHVLALGEILEGLGLLSPWKPTALDVAEALNVAPARSRQAMQPDLLLPLHDALSRRAREALLSSYERLELPGQVRFLPRKGAARVSIMALHGAGDRGLRFAGVFYELLTKRPVRLACPDSQDKTWGEVDEDLVASLCEGEAEGGGALFLVGLSAGANLALKLRSRLASVVRGVVAVGSAPGRMKADAAGVPTLYVHGSADAVFPLAEAQDWLASGAEPRSRLVAVEGMGHSFPYRVLEREAWPWMAGL